jgi:hypothetical protein
MKSTLGSAIHYVLIGLLIRLSPMAVLLECACRYAGSLPSLRAGDLERFFWRRAISSGAVVALVTML